MTDQPEIWVRAFIRRGDDLDVVRETECDSPVAADILANQYWAEQIFDRVTATAHRPARENEPAKVEYLADYGHAAAPTAEAPGELDRPTIEAFGVHPRQTPKA